MSDDFMTGYVAGQSEGCGNNNNCGFGNWGDSWLWVIVIFALLFGWGGNRGGFGGFGGGGSGVGENYVLATDFATIERKLDGVNNGICSLGYDQLNQMNGINTNLASGFAGVNNAVCTLGYQNAQLVNGLENTIQNSTWQLANGQTALGTQIANCCCENKQLLGDLKYTMATNTRDITDAQAASTRAILDAIQQDRVAALQDKIAAQQAQITDLRFAASQQAQNAYITASQAAQTQQIIDKLSPCPVPAYVVPNPNVCSPYTVAVAGNYGCGGCNG